MPRSVRARFVLLATSLLMALTASLVASAAASAFTESYGFFEVGNNGFVQSAAAHTFIMNTGVGHTGGRLACQLFNSKGANEVTHGNGSCGVFYGGGAFVWARVYNQSGATESIGGEAET